MKIGELFYALRFDADTTKLNEFVKMVGELNMSSIMAGLGVGALFDVSKKWLDSTRETAMDMMTFQNLTGISAQQMKAWSNAAEMAGVKAGAFESSIGKLQEALYQVSLGARDDGLLQAFHILRQYAHSDISEKDSVFVQYEKIRKAWAQIPQQFRRSVIEGFHMDDSMVNMMMAPDSIWEKRLDQHAIIKPEEIARMAELNAQWKELGIELTNIGKTYATNIAPAIISSTKWLIELIKDLKNSWVGDFIKMMGRGIGNAGRIIDIGYTYSKAAAMDWRTNALKFSPIYKTNFSNAGNSGKGPVTIISNQYINGDDVPAMKQAIKNTWSEALYESYFGAPNIGF